jgi:hypothetical protein
LATGLVSTNEVKPANGGCILTVDVSVLQAGPLAQVLCANASGCTASSSIASVAVNTLGNLAATAVASSATETSNGTACTPSGTTTIASLSIGGTTIVIPNPVPPCFAVIPPPLSGIASITLNEQICAADGTFTVNAIHITVLGSLQDIKIAQSKVKNSCCAGKCVPRL